MISPDHLPWKSMEPAIRLGEDEKLVETFGTHWIKYVSPTLLYLLFLLVGVGLLFLGGMHVSSAMFGLKVSFVMGLLILLCIHHWFFHRILSEGMEDVIITTKRFIFLEAHLWLENEIREISLERILAVEAQERGVVQNVLRYGSLWFDTGGSDIAMGTIKLIPHPHQRAKVITELLHMR